VFVVTNLNNSVLPLKPLFDREDLFLPDLDTNIAKILPTSLTLFGEKMTKSKTLVNALKPVPGWQQLTENEITNVVFIVLDALGYNQFMQYSILLKDKFTNFGIPLSSVFPTISSTCLASLRLGEMPIDHGIVGQKIQFTEIDNVVDTLTLRAKNSHNDLISAGVNVSNWLWCDYPLAKYQSKIQHIGLIENYIANSGFSHFIHEHPLSIGYSSHIDCFAAAKRILEKEPDKKTYLEIYTASIDSITHRYTTDSLTLQDEIQNIETILFSVLNRLEPKVASKTAVIITADHGQENLSFDNKIVITTEEEDELKTLLRHRGRSGRVIHLFSKEDKHEEVVEWFTEKVGDKGVILTPKQYPLLMGKEANSQRVVDRLGDVQVILGKNASLFFGHDGDYDLLYDLDLNATHGSLSNDELLVPLLLGQASEFIK